MKFFIRILFLCLSLSSITAFSQKDTIKAQIIKDLSKQLKYNYIDREIGRKMSDSLIGNFENGTYDTSLNLDEFCFELTRNLRKISHDRHLYFRYSKEKRARYYGNYIDWGNMSEGQRKRKEAKLVKEYKKAMKEFRDMVSQDRPFRFLVFFKEII